MELLNWIRASGCEVGYLISWLWEEHEHDLIKYISAARTVSEDLAFQHGVAIILLERHGCPSSAVPSLFHIYYFL